MNFFFFSWCWSKTILNVLGLVINNIIFRCCLEIDSCLLLPLFQSSVLSSKLSVFHLSFVAEKSLPKLSMQSVTLLGDSNIRRHMSMTACRANPVMSQSQQLSCGLLTSLVETLSLVRPESTICLIACLTNFLTQSTETSSSVSQRVEPVLLEVNF